MPCQALRLQSRRAGSSLIGGSFDRYLYDLYCTYSGELGLKVKSYVWTRPFLEYRSSMLDQP